MFLSTHKQQWVRSFVHIQRNSTTFEIIKQFPFHLWKPVRVHVLVAVPGAGVDKLEETYSISISIEAFNRISFLLSRFFFQRITSFRMQSSHNDYKQQINDFFTIITCRGTHLFLQSAIQSSIPYVHMILIYIWSFRYRCISSCSFQHPISLVLTIDGDDRLSGCLDITLAACQMDDGIFFFTTPIHSWWYNAPHA